MNKKLCILAIVVAFLVGLLTALLLVSLTGKPNTDWLKVSVEPKTFGVGYTSEAIFGSDIPLPLIKEISGKTKFIEDTNDTSTVKLGYLVIVTVDKLDKSKVPEKYLKQKPTIIEGRKILQEPIDEVVYEVVFSFILKDKDGFDLIEVVSKPETIFSGKKNEFQSIVQQQIPVSSASRSSQILLKTKLTKYLGS